VGVRGVAVVALLAWVEDAVRTALGAAGARAAIAVGGVAVVARLDAGAHVAVTAGRGRARDAGVGIDGVAVVALLAVVDGHVAARSGLAGVRATVEVVHVAVVALLLDRILAVDLAVA